MNGEFNIGPSPATVEDFQHMAGFLGGSRIYQRGFFDDSGFFTAVPRGTETSNLNSTDMWAPLLKRFDPEYHGIRTTNSGFIQVVRYNPGRLDDRILMGKPILTIAPGNARFVGRVERVKVGNSCMLLANFKPWEFVYGNSFASLKEIDEIVSKAVKGEKPPFFSDQPFIRVPEEYRDRELTVVELEFRVPPKRYDAVVMDGSNFIGRTIEYPLHPDHFDLKDLIP